MSTSSSHRGRRSSETLLSDQLFYATASQQNVSSDQFIPPTSMEDDLPLVLVQTDDTFSSEYDELEAFVGPILERISKLLSLPANWDTHGARPINPGIATKAIELILGMLKPNDPQPSVVPTSRGGILLEWHEAGIDLEVDIRSPSSIHVAFEQDDHEEEFEHATDELIADKLNLLRDRIR